MAFSRIGEANWKLVKVKQVWKHVFTVTRSISEPTDMRIFTWVHVTVTQEHVSVLYEGSGQEEMKIKW